MLKVPRFKAYFELFLVSLIWGAAAVVIKLTLKGIDPFPFMTYRFFISGIIGLFSLPYFISLLKTKKSALLPLVLIQSVFGTTLALGSLFLGLDRTNALSLSLSTLIVPVLMAVLGMRIFHDHLSHKMKIGAGIAIVGVLIGLVAPAFSKSMDSQLIGNLFVVGYVVFDVAASIALKKLVKSGFSPIHLTQISFLIGFITSLPITLSLMPVNELVNTVVTLPFKYHLGVLYMAIISGSIAFTLRAKAQKTLTVTEVGFFAYLTPMITGFLAVLVLGETLSPLFIVGAAFVFTGVAYAEWRKYKV